MKGQYGKGDEMLKKRLVKRVYELEGIVEELIDTNTAILSNVALFALKDAMKEKLVDCMVCGCLLKESNAVEGKKEVLQDSNGRDYIFTEYFCREHAPTDLDKDGDDNDAE